MEIKRKYQCPQCKGLISRLGKREKPFLCRQCDTWYSEDEVCVKPTNADHIRSMSDEELSSFLLKVRNDDVSMWCEYNKSKCEIRTRCSVCRLDWLKQEAEL